MANNNESTTALSGTDPTNEPITPNTQLADQTPQKSLPNGQSADHNSLQALKRSIEEAETSQSNKRKSPSDNDAANSVGLQADSPQSGRGKTADELMKLIQSVPKKISAKLANAVKLYVSSDEIARVANYLESEDITGLNLTSKIIVLAKHNYLIAELCEKTMIPAFRELLAKLTVPYAITEQPPNLHRDPSAFLVLITGFGGSSKQADIKSKLIKQNKLLSSSNFIITRLFAKREPFTAILNLRTKQLYDQILEQEVVHVGSSAVLVYRYTNARMCMRCLQFDHAEDQCEYGVTWCARCGASDHLISECTKVDKPRCRNCGLRGERWTTHMATAPNCPYRLDVLDGLARQMVG